MGFFKKTKVEKRSIEEMFTPKDEKFEEENGCEEVENNKENENSSFRNEVKVESREESSFNAVRCFGWSETKTPKFLIKCANFWYWAISFIWFVFGALTFAPIMFIYKKVDVLFKDNKKSFVVACVIYLFFALLIALFVW